MCSAAGIPVEIHDAITKHDDGPVRRRHGERYLLETELDLMGGPSENCAPRSPHFVGTHAKAPRYRRKQELSCRD